MTTFVIPKEYGYVLATSAATFLVAMWHGTRVIGYRKNARVPLPQCYASAESIAACADPKEKKAKYLFNCAQRAHANFLENYTPALAGLLIAGLQYPVLSAAAGVAWTISRIVYAVGYTDPNKVDGKGRFYGGLGEVFWVSQLVWAGLVGKMGYDFIKG